MRSGAALSASGDKAKALFRVAETQAYEARLASGAQASLSMPLISDALNLIARKGEMPQLMPKEAVAFMGLLEYEQARLAVSWGCSWCSGAVVLCSMCCSCSLF